MNPLKVYVILGFHVSFYHSWRGDSPDEAGFGTDIRVVREILRILERAQGEGRSVRGYWDLDAYWNMQIIPRHAPDIIQGIRRRVESGMDEIVPMPFNNGANHAATEDEFRTAVAYAFENPYGTGVRQVFGTAAPFFRPQESMYTTGQNAILLENGVTGVFLAYSGTPYNALGAFIPALSLEQRYNPLWFRTFPEEKPIIVLPWISAGDLVENVCLEALLLKLHDLQSSGRIQSDVVIHFNQDADSEAWLPVRVPKPFAWFPNTGGLEEYIRVVNRYDWAEFTTPSEYLKAHPPKGEVLVRQDLADGGFDGSYSWAEKCASQRNWTALERSRLYSYRAMALAERTPGPAADGIQRRLWEGVDSSFFQRLIGLTTTHFGMSTPIINEERQAKAEALLTRAQQVAFDAEREAAHTIRLSGSSAQDAASLSGFSGPQAAEPSGGQGLDGCLAGDDAWYVFELFDFPRGRRAAPQAVRSIVALPVVLPEGVNEIVVEDMDRNRVRASLVNRERLPDGRTAAEILFVVELGALEHRLFRVRQTCHAADSAGSRGGADAIQHSAQTEKPGRQVVTRLRNEWLDVRFSEGTGFASVRFQDRLVGDSEFLKPFITYGRGKKPVRDDAQQYELADLSDEAWDGLARARLQTQVTFWNAKVPYTNLFTYTFSLFDQLPYLVVDVEARYARTPARDVIQALQQKLRRLIDLGWVEVAPFQLNPALTAEAGQTLRIWKHNYLDVVSPYELDYGALNPKNKDLDSFNHQVTAGWLAVTNRQAGLLLAENAEVLASMAFCPMRLRQRDGLQYLSLNPFGSYFGRQLNYQHLGGNGIGAALTSAISGALKPNGPSYNGQTVRFSLLLAPYIGDQPPRQTQNDAMGFFYPLGIVYHKTPPGIEVVVAEDMRRWIEAARTESKLALQTPPAAPDAVLASPSDGAVDLVWEATRGAHVTGYEVRWRATQSAEWHVEAVLRVGRHRVNGLENGCAYVFQLRALAADQPSPWTEQVRCIPGAVTATSVAAALPGLNLWLMVKMVAYSVWAVLRARLRGGPSGRANRS